ncbi:MAG: hypothetical protein O2960_18390 [Verrucomicrobia bacterium]|nr:hypothetical protein [Verrucomicrobiota bacterium]
MAAPVKLVTVPVFVTVEAIADPAERVAAASWFTLKLNEPLLNAPVAEIPNDALFVRKVAGLPSISVLLAFALRSCAARAAVLSLPSSDCNVENKDPLDWIPLRSADKRVRVAKSFRDSAGAVLILYWSLRSSRIGFDGCPDPIPEIDEIPMLAINS